MDPHEPFLKAILADRHNDLPRLVYADWLEESGEPQNVARAHFIRTQINLENTDPKSDLYHEMKALEARILDWYLDEWQHELPEPLWYSEAMAKVVWRRGFPDDLGPMSVEEFRRFGAPALEQTPLTALRLEDRTSGIPFGDHPSLCHLRKLKVGPRFADLLHLVYDVTLGIEVRDSVTSNSLLTAPVFTDLRHLELSENLLDDAWLVTFAAGFTAASFAPTLETLDLSGNFGITNAGANVLATAPGLDGLKTVRLKDTSITTAGMNMLKKRFGIRLR